jgi:hypothetical protein
LAITILAIGFIASKLASHLHGCPWINEHRAFAREVIPCPNEHEIQLENPSHEDQSMTAWLPVCHRTRFVTRLDANARLLAAFRSQPEYNNEKER